MKQRGFSLIELIVCCALFVSLSVLVFSFFRYGTRAFQKANQRHGMQTDALRSVESLQHEFKRSSHASVSILNDASRAMTVEGTPVQRDVVCFGSLKDWSDKTSSENFDLETTAPKWNRYWVFYATKEEEGRFIRLKADPSTPPDAPLRLIKSKFDLLYNDDPNANSFEGITPTYVSLAKNVFHFSIQEPQRGSYQFSLKLKEKHQLDSTEPGARRPFDYYELQLSIRPENSFPNDF